MEDSGNELFEKLKGYGLAAKLTSLDHICYLQREIDDLRKQELLDEQFYIENLDWINFNHKDTMSDAKSILVVAIPQYITRLSFQYRDKEYFVTIPHTYVHSEVSARVEKALDSILTHNGYSYKRTYLPVKLLAVSTGLGMYGRNNICYVEGMGSFLRLFSFYTDIPFSGDGCEEKAVMPGCKTCTACAKACPTGCINENRFLINAERCITNFNEKEGDFPSWIDENWHNAIVGCMKCQNICPQNKSFIGKVDKEVIFTNEESELLLKKVPFMQLPDYLKQKLDKLDLTEYYEVLHRNLSLLIR